MRTPIGPDDRIRVRGRYLYRGNSTRFFVRGMAFPVAPPSISTTEQDDGSHSEYFVNATGWMPVLDQLATETDVNTVRLYTVNCTRPDDYHAFFDHAAELGLYVILPLTAASGDGVLYRTEACQTRKHRDALLRYGQACLDLASRHANILAGTIGNEVLNTLDAWPAAAPCVRTYLHDLSHTMQQRNKNHVRLPLLYAAQHDSPTANVGQDQAMSWTLQYLACREESGRVDNDTHTTSDYNVDLIFGINIESWCSSLQSFEYEEDGVTESSYHALWRTLQRTTVSTPVPVIFSEMGCSRALFNRDNGLGAVTGETETPRDWRQISVVLQDMADVWSGFLAYAYDGGGSENFRIMSGGIAPWRGQGDVLPSNSSDYKHFRHQLHQAVVELETNTTATTLETADKNVSWPSCDVVRAQIAAAWHVDLSPHHTLIDELDDLRVRYCGPHWVLPVGTVLLVLLGVIYFFGRQRHCWKASPPRGPAAGPTEGDPLLG